MKNNSGFTLIELLITIFLIGIIGTLTTQVLIMGFRSQNKSEIIKEVKQNGDYAMQVMESMVGNASDFTQGCNDQGTDQLEIVNPDGLTTTFICTEGAQLASQSSTTQSLTSSKVVVHNCSTAFRIICPTPALNPKYVFILFTLSQAAVPGQPDPLPENRASLEYQSTISLGNYQ